ncbi:MAG TPA: prolipoprotein diacylglyceryl transferase [Ferruginibacter sp.]|nr:prolipoprotein diacylglyceryl transferase [Ferruginibacter sp.]HMP21776.1 prolipoprotein diacylglyceryl transferase [Ferruginibacter sp.]
MYPNLYYVFKDWFGVEWRALGYLNTFGLMVAVSFIAAAAIITAELKRKEKQGLLFPREEFITVGKPASLYDLLLNFITGFLFAYKIGGLFFEKPETESPQSYIFSTQGSLLAGILVGAAMAWMKWRDKEKQKLKTPELRNVRIWPHDRVGDIVIISLVFGIIGAKLFDSLENWDDLVAHPLERLFSAGGLTFYGGLILAAVAIIIYASAKRIKLIHLSDAIMPALMLAYAIGRIGCQVAGDGDWGIFNSAYITDSTGHAVLAKPGEFQQQLQQYSTYFLDGTVLDSGNPVPVSVTDRTSESLDKVPHKPVIAPSWLPVWAVAYSYRQNVNKDGIAIAGIEEEHNRALPVPVFPTPLYETLLCTLIFLGLWFFRKNIRPAGMMTGLYLLLNGIERYSIETIRVNHTYPFLGFEASQAQIIAMCIILSGIIFIVMAGAKLFEKGKPANLPS